MKVALAAAACLAFFPAVALGLAPAKPLAEKSAAEKGPRWQVDYKKSRLGFSGTQTGKPFEGQFRKYDAKIVFDPANLATSSIDVTVDMSSAATGDKQRDAALPGSDWFKSKEFPSARFLARRIEKKPDGGYLAYGELDMRGVKKALLLPFTLKIAGDMATAKGEASLVRSDWGVGQGEFADGTWVALEVKVFVDITATR
jgi:polyisoprenoid-binding protein YceI